MKESVVAIPKWFEKYRLDDAISAKAYEEAHIEHKAAIKSAIALHFAVNSEQLPIRTMRTKGAFTLHEEISPCSAAIFVLQKDFNSPAKLIAGIMPALFAKAPVIVIMQEKISQDMLLSLELLGIEHIFLVEDKNNIEKLCLELHSNNLAIMCASLGFEHKFTLFAKENNLPTMFYNNKINILATSSLFKIAYPNATIYADISEIPKDKRVHIAEEEIVKDKKLPYPVLILGNGLEFYTEMLFPIEDFLIKNRKFVFID